MSNTLTNLIPDIYAALDVVSRELVGFIPAVARDFSADQVALNQTLRGPVTPANAAGGNVTPAMALPSAADQVITNKDVTISKSRYFPFSWSGEEQKAMDTGPGFLTIQQDQIAQAIRAAVNELEADLADAAHKGASRAYGAAAATPFATTLVDPANIKKILDDNGAPMSDRTLIINTTAGAALRTLAQLTKANEAGDTLLLRRGTLLDLHGFMIRESAQVKTFTKGTGATYNVDLGGGYAVGATTIHVEVGAGTFLAGDVITFAGDLNKYVIATGFAGDGDGDIVLAAPGLLQTLANDVAITFIATHACNVGFSRNAILLATRLPAVPKEGDLAIDHMVIEDPVSGLVFDFAAYPGFRMIVYHVSIAWGVKVIKPEHIAILLG